MALRRLERLEATANQAGGSVWLSFELHPRFQTRSLRFLPFAFFASAFNSLCCWRLASVALAAALPCRAALSTSTSLARHHLPLAPLVRSSAVLWPGTRMYSSVATDVLGTYRLVRERQHPALALAPEAAIARCLTLRL